MGVEAGRDEKEIGGEGVERGKDARLVGRAEIVAVVAGLERRVEDIAHARLVEGAGAGKERHLVGRAVEQVAVGPERGLRAIAVMHVEIDHRHALGAVGGAGVQRRDRDGVEQAKAHRPRRLGVVARRPHRAEGIVGLARHDLIDRMECRARRPERRLPASRRDDRVRIEHLVIARRDRGSHHLDIGLGMQPLDRGEVGAAALPRASAT